MSVSSTAGPESGATHYGLSIVLPTYNEGGSIERVIDELLELDMGHPLEILVVDDDSRDGTADLVRSLARQDARIRIIQRVGRSGLASAIKEGLMAALHPVAVVMDSDGQHQPTSVRDGVHALENQGLDLVAGSRFLDHSEIHGLSHRRTDGSTIANRLARWSLPGSYSHLTDCMSGFIVLRLDRCLPLIRQVDVNGFKFFYELLAMSRGRLTVGEIPLSFQPRLHGTSKLDLAILWDFVVSLLHTATLRLLPRRAISFGLVGASGVVVQLVTTALLMGLIGLTFQHALPIAVITAASSNYLVNNALTFRDRRQSGRQLLRGLLKFLLVASLPALANVGLATSFYTLIEAHALWAQLAGIVVVYVWNYAASSRFVWNTP
ncbi:MAG: glycosyltransferase [Synechococcus sp.]